MDTLEKASTLKVQFRLGTYRTPNTSSVALIVATGTWVYVGTKQAQVVAIVVTVRSRRPIVAVGASIEGRRRIEEAGVEEVVRIFTPSVGGFSGRLACTNTTHICI